MAGLLMSRPGFYAYPRSHTGRMDTPSHLRLTHHLARPVKLILEEQLINFVNYQDCFWVIFCVFHVSLCTFKKFVIHLFQVYCFF